MTTTDARKRNAATQLCRTLHPLEWRDDNQGRTTACSSCQTHAELLAAQDTVTHIVVADAMSRPPENPDALIEDLEWMNHHGESLEGAAHRLNRTTAALERSLLRYGRPDLVNALRARNPLNPHRNDHLRRKDHAA